MKTIFTLICILAINNSAADIPTEPIHEDRLTLEDEMDARFLSLGQLTKGSHSIVVGKVLIDEKKSIRLSQARLITGGEAQPEAIVFLQYQQFTTRHFAAGERVAVFCAKDPYKEGFSGHNLEIEFNYRLPGDLPSPPPDRLYALYRTFSIIRLPRDQEDEILAVLRGYMECLRVENPDMNIYLEFLKKNMSSKIKRIHDDSRQDLRALFSRMNMESLEKMVGSGELGEEGTEMAKRILGWRKAYVPPKPYQPPPQTDETIRADLKSLKTADWQAKSGILSRFLYPKDPEWILSRKDIWVDDIAELVESKESQLVRSTAADILIKVKDIRALHYLLDEMESEQPDLREEAWAVARKFLPPDVSFDPAAPHGVRKETMKHIRALSKDLMARPAKSSNPPPAP